MKTYIRKNRDLLQIDKSDGNIVNHKIFAIMDKDEASDELFQLFIDKSLFKDYWWGQEKMIEPIYFNPNMDTVLRNHGVNIDTRKHKPAQYFKLFTARYNEMINIFLNLNEKESNIKSLFEYLEQFEDKK